MKISFSMSGGFAAIPVLSRPTIVDTTQLDSNAATQLESLVKKSSFFDQPQRVGTVARGAADYITYTITVEDDNKSHTVQITDPIRNDSLHQLVVQLRLMNRPSSR